MLTKEQIKAQLKENPYWEPEDKAPQKVWDMYYDVYQQMVEDGEIELDDTLGDDLLDVDKELSNEIFDEYLK